MTNTVETDARTIAEAFTEALSPADIDKVRASLIDDSAHTSEDGEVWWAIATWVADLCPHAHPETNDALFIATTNRAAELVAELIAV